jgi:hypothetical protein
LRNTGGDEPFVLFDANLDDAPTAHFVLRIDWEDTIVVSPGGISNPPQRLINFDPETDPEGYEPVQACTRLISEGTFESLDPDPDDVYGHPTDSRFENDELPWCLAGEQLVLLDSGEWQQVQWFDGEGPDPRFR